MTDINTFIGVDLLASDLSASCDLLVRIDPLSASGGLAYCPQVVTGTYSITDDQRFALSFGGMSWGLIQEEPAGLWQDHHASTAPPTRSRSPTVIGKPRRSWLRCGGWLTETRRRLRSFLNRHCPLCPFRTECLAKAEADDDLSLLDRMTPKAIRRYHKKGIFTVNQLSYVFRPRRKRKRTKATARL